MEDIRLACGISRGGLYHHFANKRAVLDGLVMQEVSALVVVLENDNASPISALLLAGSSHLNGEPGILSACHSTAEKLDYLSALEQATSVLLRNPLSAGLVGAVVEGIRADHVAELFLTINGHINRREILGEWTAVESASFAATSLGALRPLLKSPSDLDQIIHELDAKALSE